MSPPESFLASQRRLFVHKRTSRSIAAFAVIVTFAYFSLSAAAQAAPALRVVSELSSLAHHTRHNSRGHFAASNLSSSLLYAKIHRSHSRQFSETAAAAHHRVHGTWSTAQMSEARYGLAATSLPLQGLALFAGGWDKGAAGFALRALLSGHWISKFVLFADQFSQIQRMKFIIGRESRTLWTSSTERRGRGRQRG